MLSDTLYAWLLQHTAYVVPVSGSWILRYPDAYKSIIVVLSSSLGKTLVDVVPFSFCDFRIMVFKLCYYALRMVPSASNV